MCSRKNDAGQYYIKSETMTNAVELTRHLMAAYNIPTENVLRHHDVTGKACPEPFVRDEAQWPAFKHRISADVSAPAQPKTAVSGDSKLTAEQMAAFLLKNNPAPKLTCSALELAQLFITEGNALAIRGDIAFMQSIHETGYFRFGGQVLPEQNNYAGIGAVNGSAVGKGAWFDTPQIGVRAQIQHLYAYCTTVPLPEGSECVDPRFGLVNRGSAVFWEDLGGKWAVPGYDAKSHGSFEAAFAAGATYGQSILALYDKAEAFAKTLTVNERAKTPEEVTVDNAIADGIISDRDHWLGVLSGIFKPVPEYIKIALDNAHNKLKGV
jgi:hypothetical protein